MIQKEHSIHYRLTHYFLRNHRLTVLCLAVLITVGVLSLLMLRTTGFPSAEVKFVLVKSIYAGASAETMTTEVVKPIEGAIKNISGIETYTSRSINSFASISVQVSQDASTDSVRSQIDSAVRSVTLPDGVVPTVSILDFSNPDLVLSVSADSLEQMHTLTQRLIQDVQELPEVRSVEPAVELRKQATVNIDTGAASVRGVSVQSVRTALSTVGELLPVASGVALDAGSQFIVTTVPQMTLDSLRDLGVTALSGDRVRLGEIATVAVEYAFVDEQAPTIGVRDAEGNTVVVPAVTVFIKTVRDVDQGAFVRAVHEIVNGYSDARLILPGEETVDRTEPWVIEHYASNTFNESQVREVIGGLIGTPLETDSMLKYAGWILGGIQLVFLVMLAFVSWRAALVAAAAIPLSLVFSTIYIYLIGEQLNTLVLFSLVLVIGLVVDPALVILESIQRKIDVGLRGKEAALAAMDDVGRGLFMATLTNIIVFLPFGLISGFLGEFFIFIPYTIIPATIGSYLVPAIFLAWIGGLFLRKSKHASQDEEKNLWGVARWIIRVNERILRSSVWKRLAIIVVAFTIPVVVAGVLFATGKITVVQFASSTDPNYLNISGEYRPSATVELKNQNSAEVMAAAVAQEGVRQVYPLSRGLYYFVNLEKAGERETVASEIAEHIQERIQLPAFFDIKTRTDQVGPQVPDYEVAVAVKVNSQEQAKRVAQNVGETMKVVCNTEKKEIVVNALPCTGDDVAMITKVDDGYTGKSQQVTSVIVDREKIQSMQLTFPGAPLSAVVNRLLRDLYLKPDDALVTTARIANEDMPIVLARTDSAPANVDELSQTIVYASAQGVVRLGDVAQIVSTESPASILRVNGQTIALIQGRLAPQFADQQTAAQVTQALVDAVKNNPAALEELGIAASDIGPYSEGSTAENAKSFQDLFLTLIFAIILTYVVLAVFFESFTQPLVILFTIPLTFLGVFPGLAIFVGGQFGFLEIIGLIILVGIVENVAIFLIDAARQKIEQEKWDDIRAISYAAGVRFRPILLTKCTAIASLMPLAIFSEIYRSIAVLIMLGLLTSGFTSLFTTPILFVFFRWLSRQFTQANWWQKILIVIGLPIAVVVLWIRSMRSR